LGHRDEAEPWVLDLPLEHRGDFLLDELIDTLEPLALHLSNSEGGFAPFPNLPQRLRGQSPRSEQLGVRSAIGKRDHAGTLRPLLAGTHGDSSTKRSGHRISTWMSVT